VLSAEISVFALFRTEPVMI